jgi:hypothetical protein
MVLARNLMLSALALAAPSILLATESFRIFPVALGSRPVVVSRRPLRGLNEVTPCRCSFG